MKTVTISFKNYSVDIDATWGVNQEMLSNAWAELLNKDREEHYPNPIINKKENGTS